MSDLLDSILTGGVAVALITLLGQFIMWYIKEKNVSAVIPVSGGVDSSIFENKIEIQRIMDRVTTNTSVNRFLILKSENGGGKPRLGSHLYASVLYESIRAPITSVKDDYQRLLVDDLYVKMLSDIGPGSPNKLNTSKMKGGILKNIYTVENIVYFEIHYIGETETAFFYLSVATDNDDNTFDVPFDRVEVEIAVSKIRDIFKKISGGVYDK